MTSCMSSMRSNQLSYASATDGIIPYAAGFVKGFLKSFLLFEKVFELLRDAEAQAGAPKDAPACTVKSYAQLMVVGFSSKMQTPLRNATALDRPSSMVIMLSSCSIDRTLS